LPSSRAITLDSVCAQNVLKDSRVSFHALGRLKFSGDATQLSISDTDLVDISRSATHLDSLCAADGTVISLEGLLHVARASSDKIRLLQYRPSSPSLRRLQAIDLGDAELICHQIGSLPRLRDLDIYIPTLCTTLLSDYGVVWSGQCMIRFERVCCELSHGPQHRHTECLRRILDDIRSIVAERKRLGCSLRVGLSTKRCLFLPDSALVHYDMTSNTSEISASTPEPRRNTDTFPMDTEIDAVGQDKEGYVTLTEVKFCEAVAEGRITI
jgi:hypothetical protein